ncbi:ROK family protein [Candidatus Pelagibacter sp.]|nr:ROK family protein [Candidatus Pelagibacter sp.]
MQVGIDVGATKIESVVLEKDGQEKHRSRIPCPKNYTQIITSIKDIHRQLELEFKQELSIGVCHPGIHSPQTGLVKNVPNITWLDKKPFQNDLRKALGKEVFCENDANCFCFVRSYRWIG